MAQPGSARVLGTRGPRFESGRPDHSEIPLFIKYKSWSVELVHARIYRQSKPAGQSGLIGTREWILEYGQTAPRVQDPLMGWTGSRGDTLSQIRLVFKSLEAAKAYAEREGIAYQVEQPTVRIKRPKLYSDNFRFDRVQNWTH